MIIKVMLINYKNIKKNAQIVGLERKKTRSV